MSHHWTWEFFETDSKFYRNNHTNKNAWCMACLNYHRTLLRESDVISSSLGNTGLFHTEETLEQQGKHIDSNLQVEYQNVDKLPLNF